MAEFIFEDDNQARFPMDDEESQDSIFPQTSSSTKTDRPSDNSKKTMKKSMKTKKTKKSKKGSAVIDQEKEEEESQHAKPTKKKRKASAGTKLIPSLAGSCRVFRDILYSFEGDKEHPKRISKNAVTMLRTVLQSQLIRTMKNAQMITDLQDRVMLSAGAFKVAQRIQGDTWLDPEEGHEYKDQPLISKSEWKKQLLSEKKC